MLRSFGTSLALLQAVPAEGPGLWELFMDTGPVDRFILGLLVVFSLASWTIIISKAVQYRRAIVHRFPYVVFYEFGVDTTTVYSVFHSAQDPRKWRIRLS